MTANPIELVSGLVTTSNVVKADLVAWAKARVPQVMADATEVRNTTLAGQLSISLLSNGAFYYQDTTDTTSADNGTTCIISSDGKRFKARFLSSNNTWSGTNAFNGGFSTAAPTPPALVTTGVTGGAPQTSGTTDANQFLIAGNGTVQWRFGFYFNGAMWSQPSLQSNYATNFGTVLNPNGGNLSIGGTTAAGATPYSNNGGATLLTVGGPIATTVSTTKTTSYTQTAYDSSLIFNGAGSLTLTLVSAASVPGQWLYVKTIAAQTVVSNASNVVPLVGGAAGTAILAATAGKWAWLQSDGSNWIIMAGN